jgi:hypothetical protein
MPITWPLRLRSGPPELPGFTAASNWIMPPMDFPLESGKERLRPEMTPVVIDPTRPRGWPITKASSPTRAPPPSTAGTTTPGSRSGASTAMSWSGSVERTDAGALVPSAKETVIVRAPSTTWSEVRISPRSLTTTPVPDPDRPRPGPTGGRSVSMTTSDGTVAW